jgi:hypothetical protein
VFEDADDLSLDKSIFKACALLHRLRDLYLELS